MKIRFLLLCFLSFWAACSEERFAGGVSEETNTLAGVLENSSGMASGVSVLARSLSTSFEVTCVSDSSGRFRMDLPYGIYALSATEKNSSFYELVRISGEDVEISAKLLKGFDISVRVLFADSSSAEGVVVSLPGTNVKSTVGENGVLEFENLPRGNYVLNLKSPSTTEFENVYYRISDSLFYGPYPDGIPLDSLSSLEISSRQTQDSVWILPFATERNLLGYWNFNRSDSISQRVSIANVREKELPFFVYGNTEFVSGVENKSLALKDSTGFAVLEMDSGIFNRTQTFSVETWVRLKDIPVEKEYRKNIVGKVGFGGNTDNSVFSLALIQGVCSVTAPSLAFFVADGEGKDFNCENAVIDSSFIDTFEWVHVVASFDKGTLKLFRNGFLMAKKETSVFEIGNSIESIYIGKETLLLDIDALRFYREPIDETGAFIRFYKHGGR